MDGLGRDMGFLLWALFIAGFLGGIVVGLLIWWVWLR